MNPQKDDVLPVVRFVRFVRFVGVVAFRIDDLMLWYNS